MFASLPFKRIPISVILEMGSTVTFWLDNECAKKGMLPNMSPQQLMTEMRLNAWCHGRHQFGDCVMARTDDTDNTMTPRAVSATHLQPS